MSAFDAMRPVLDELRAMGVRVSLHSRPRGGIRFELHDSFEWSREFSRQVAEVLTRHGMEELREGLWGSQATTGDEIRQMEEDQRSDDEYKDIHRTIAEHPDWSDEEVAESCGVDVDYVAELRYERDR